MHLYADVINLKEKMCMQETKGREEVKKGRWGGGVVGKEEGVMPSACSLGNLSNLESCQDTERLCQALPLLPPMCIQVCA